MQNQNQQLQEQLSAIMDGEASELELRRFLQQIDELPELEKADMLAQWQRYHVTSESLSGSTTLSAAPDFAQNMRAALAKEEASQQVSADAYAGADGAVTATAPTKGSSPQWQRFALAASVALAVIVGFQQVRISGQAEQLRVATADQIKDASSVNTGVPAAEEALQQSQSAALLASSGTDIAEGDQQEARRRLQQYLLEHANHAAQQNSQGIVPFARVANFESE